MGGMVKGEKMKAVNISELKAIPIEIPKKYDQESFLAGAGEVLNRLYKLEEKDVEPVKRGEWEEKEVFNVSQFINKYFNQPCTNKLLL